MVIGGQGCPHILVKLYWLRGQVLSLDSMIFVLDGRDGFTLGISKFDKVTRTKILWIICVDDSSMIFCVSGTYIFQSIIFSINLFSDNNKGFIVKSLGINFQI
jgi:hypothetical protein